MLTISTIFTGGTIGSRLNTEKTISTSGDAPYRLLEMYKEKYSDDIKFVTSSPYTILSENLDAAAINKLIIAVSAALESNPDGVILTHGTDTLQYTAAILGYVFGDANVPIVLVSSDYILDDKRANGLCNFIYAVDFIKNRYGKGVFVSYKNSGGRPTIHRGTRLQASSVYSANLFSTLDSYYGYYDSDDKFVQNSLYKVCEGNLPAITKDKKVVLSDNAGEILRIRPFPGMMYHFPDNCVKAVLHESYHSGTIAVNSELSLFCYDAEAKNIPIYLTGLNQSEAVYETVEEYKKLGIIPLPECSTIAQFCKLWLALSLGLDIRQIMGKSVAEDFIA